MDDGRIYRLNYDSEVLKIAEPNQDNQCGCGCEDGEVTEKIETCYFCLKKFDINKYDISHYKFGKYPMCAYCSEFYGFYSD